MGPLAAVSVTLAAFLGVARNTETCRNREPCWQFLIRGWRGLHSLKHFTCGLMQLCLQTLEQTSSLGDPHPGKRMKPHCSEAAGFSGGTFQETSGPSCLPEGRTAPSGDRSLPPLELAPGEGTQPSLSSPCAGS